MFLVVSFISSQNTLFWLKLNIPREAGSNHLLNDHTVFIKKAQSNTMHTFIPSFIYSFPKWTNALDTYQASWEVVGNIKNYILK